MGTRRYNPGGMMLNLAKNLAPVQKSQPLQFTS